MCLNRFRALVRRICLRFCSSAWNGSKGVVEGPLAPGITTGPRARFGDPLINVQRSLPAFLSSSSASITRTMDIFNVISPVFVFRSLHSALLHPSKHFISRVMVWHSSLAPLLFTHRARIPSMACCQTSPCDDRPAFLCVWS